MKARIKDGYMMKGNGETMEREGIQDKEGCIFSAVAEGLLDRRREYHAITTPGGN